MKRKKPEQTPTIRTPELSTLSGFTARHLRDLAARGLFPAPDHGTYELVPTCRGLITHFRELLTQRNNAEKRQRLPELEKARPAPAKLGWTGER